MHKNIYPNGVPKLPKEKPGPHYQSRLSEEYRKWDTIVCMSEICLFVFTRCQDVAEELLISFWLGNAQTMGGENVVYIANRGAKICFSIYAVALINCGIIECSSPGFKKRIPDSTQLCCVQNPK